MTNKSIPHLCFFALLLCLPTLFFGQAAFEKYAHQQDSLMLKAYYDRDDKQYEKVLADYLARCKKLKPEEQKLYQSRFSGAYYNLACLYALQNNKTQAVKSLETSVDKGYQDYYHILDDSDLNTIREEAGYKKVVSNLREVSDYLYILKKADNYNANDTREVPKFTYQASNDPNLVALRKAFNLDSIAGSGNDLSQILNLCHWIHNLVPHDGNHANPVVKNAMSMIAVCKQEKRGLNCRGLATVLNECYLALGISSRFLTCLPKDSLGTDTDCHVINMVYSASLKKWLWIDPTFDAYVMNEQGEMLSVEEVRERIIRDQPLILNPDANWNHKSSETKAHYLLNYMAKNLYMFQCPLSSEYDTETQSTNKAIRYIQLYPLNYHPQPAKAVNYKDGETTYINYPTNNPALFWQKP